MRAFLAMIAISAGVGAPASACEYHLMFGMVPGIAPGHGAHWRNLDDPVARVPTPLPTREEVANADPSMLTMAPEPPSFSASRRMALDAARRAADERRAQLDLEAESAPDDEGPRADRSD